MGSPGLYYSWLLMARHRSTGIICLGFWLNEGGVECELGAWAFTPAEWDHPRTPHNHTQLLPLLKIYRLATTGRLLHSCCCCCCCFSLPKVRQFIDTKTGKYSSALHKHWSIFWRDQLFSLFERLFLWMFSRALPWLCLKPALTNQYLLHGIPPNGARPPFLQFIQHLAPDGSQ